MAISDHVEMVRLSQSGPAVQGADVVPWSRCLLHHLNSETQADTPPDFPMWWILGWEFREKAWNSDHCTVKLLLPTQMRLSRPGLGPLLFSLKWTFRDAWLLKIISENNSQENFGVNTAEYTMRVPLRILLVWFLSPNLTFLMCLFFAMPTPCRISRAGNRTCATAVTKAGSLTCWVTRHFTLIQSQVHDNFFFQSIKLMLVYLRFCKMTKQMKKNKITHTSDERNYSKLGNET